MIKIKKVSSDQETLPLLSPTTMNNIPNILRNTDAVNEILAEFQEVETKDCILEQMLVISEKLKKLSASNIKQVAFLLELNGLGLIAKGTINLIQGRHGSNKSRFAEFLMSFILLTPGSIIDSLGFAIPIQERFAIVFIDTERSINDELPGVLQRVRRNAGYDSLTDPENFYYSSIKSLNRGDRLRAIQEYIAYVRKDTQLHLCIFLDVLTDCVKSFNDEVESLALMDFLGKLTDDYNCTVFSVIHENPLGNEMKAKGHTGTEASNKASTIIRIGYEKASEGAEPEVIKIQFPKVRYGKRPSPINLSYDTETNSLKRCVDTNLDNKKSNSIQTLIDVLGRELINPKQFGELHKVIGTSVNTLRSKLLLISKDKIPVFNSEGKSCQLTIHKGLRNSTLYSLIPIQVE